VSKYPILKGSQSHEDPSSCEIVSVEVLEAATANLLELEEVVDRYRRSKVRRSCLLSNRTRAGEFDC
jgi:hypothetical protein